MRCKSPMDLLAISSRFALRSWFNLWPLSRHADLAAPRPGDGPCKPAQECSGGEYPQRALTSVAKRRSPAGGAPGPMVDRLGVHQFADSRIAVLAGLAEERVSEHHGRPGLYSARPGVVGSAWVERVASQTS